MYEKIPNELKKLSQWGYYHRIWNDEKGKYNKIPKNPYNGGDGKTNDQSTWSDFDTAMQALKTYPDADGLAFYFANGYVGLDIDHIANDLNNAKSGDTNPNNLVNKARELTHGSYMETSMSGEGIHVIFKGEILGKRRRKGNYEMYQSGRFFALTGNSLMAEPEIKSLNSHDMQILYEHYFHDGKAAGPTQKQVEPVAANNLSDDEIIERAENATNGERFKSFMDGGWESSYNSHSEADMAFANDLAFWCGRDFNQMDRIFRQSALYRKKYDEKRGKTTYGYELLNKAINETTSVFNPHQPLNLNYDMSFLQNNGDADDKKQVDADLVEIDQDAENAKYEEQHKAKQPLINEPKLPADMIANMEKLKAMQEKSKTLPNWAYQDGLKVKAYPAALGHAILKENDYFYTKSIDNTTSKVYYQLYQYNPKIGLWVAIGDQTIKHLISVKLVSVNAWTAKAARETFQYVSDGIEIKPISETIDNIQPRYAHFKNGVYDFKTNQILPHSKEYYFTNGRDYALEPDKNAPETNAWLVESFGDGYKTMMEYIGYMFYRSYEPIQAFVIVKSGGGEGKSTFFREVEKLIGDGNYSSLPLSNLTPPLGNGNKNFDVAELYHKQANINADISNSIIGDTGALKRLTGGDTVSTNVKNHGMMQAEFYAKLLFGANELPPFRDNTHGFERRINVLDFESIPNFKEKYNLKTIRDERGAFAYECIQLAKQAMERNSLTQTESIKKNRREWINNNDPVQEFIDECCTLGKDCYIEKSTLYDRYKIFCRKNAHNPLSSQKFKADLKGKGIPAIRKRIGDARPYVYVGIDMPLYSLAKNVVEMTS